MSKTLITGSSGLLGKHLVRLFPDADHPSHEQLDITKPETLKGDYDLIIHSAGYTDVVKAETDRTVYDVNVMGTYNLIRAYPEANFVYISTEYVIHPINVYSHTKLIGEAIIKTSEKNSLIIRTLFKERPFPHDKAFTDQYTMGDYVDTIALLIADAIKRFRFHRNSTYHIGTGRKTIFDLAKKSNHFVEPMSVDDIKGVTLPKDYL